MGLEETGNVTDQNELDTILNLEATDELKAEIAAARIVANLLVDPEYSAGAESTDNGYVFTTTVEDNSFNGVEWQLFTSEWEYILNISTQLAGVKDGDYTFPYESGNYVIRYKANSNKKDEAVSKTLYLEKDVTYHYVAVVESLEPQRVVVSNVAFGVKK